MRLRISVLAIRCSVSGSCGLVPVALRPLRCWQHAPHHFSSAAAPRPFNVAVFPRRLAATKTPLPVPVPVVPLCRRLFLLYLALRCAAATASFARGGRRSRRRRVRRPAARRCNVLLTIADPTALCRHRGALQGPRRSAGTEALDAARRRTATSATSDGRIGISTKQIMKGGLLHRRHGQIRTVHDYDDDDDDDGAASRSASSR